ncbi:MAG: TonB-dependent receptor plug domain-containing protein, partial [Flavobacteriales bacterium]|nr:TonB-dependent receptor plug domain-containing protein [Flavobacteriales bacterium]
MTRRLLYISIFVTLPFLVDAQVFSDSILLDEVEIIHKKEVIHSVGSRLDVIELKTINNSISESFSDLLQNNSTIYVKKYGALSTPSFRGTSSSHTLFLWNGIPITSATTSQTDLRLIPT